nr:DEAD/DEAH box helicase [Candidatus Gracilibacteria bacterium]
MNFNELGLKADIVKALDEIGYTTPTQIQSDVIVESNNGKNVIGQSQTGTGKTAAFVLSLLQNLDLKKRGTQALIIAPTRELVSQIKDEIFKLSKYHRVSSLAVYGGSPIYKQIDLIRRGQDIVIGTPGRVIDLIERNVLKLEHINYFVLDEVDRMLDMGFVDDIEFIWEGLTNLKQVFSFSATITPEIKKIIETHLGVNYTFIKSTDAITTEKIDHSFVESPHINKYDLLNKFIATHKSQKTIVFVQTKRDTEILAERLNKDGFKASYLNGDMRQRERFKALKDFQDGYSSIFVVTDVAARGLNMKNIELVVNFDVPTDPESYIHRIGRTGRAGASGKAITFVSGSEKYALKNIERTNKIKIKQVNNEGVEIERKEEPSSGRGGFGGRSGGKGGRGGFGGRSGGGRGGFGGGGRSSGGRFGGSRGGNRDEGRSFGSKDSTYRKSDDNNSSSHREGGYFQKRDERRGQRPSTRNNSDRGDNSRSGHSGFRGNRGR